MRKRNFLNEMMRDLDKASRILQEAYVFNDDEENGMLMDDEMGPDVDDEEMGYGPRHGMDRPMHKDEGGDSAEEQEMHMQDIIKHEPIVGKIRDIAIEGLKKYADDPTSQLYTFMKKVFLECDKVLTDTGSK